MEKLKKLKTIFNGNFLKIELKDKKLNIVLQSENKKIDMIFEYVYSYKVKPKEVNKENGFFELLNSKFLDEYVYQATGSQYTNIEEIKGYIIRGEIYCYLINDDNTSIEILAAYPPKFLNLKNDGGI